MHSLLLADISVLIPFVEYFHAVGGNAAPILDEERVPQQTLDRGEGKITKVQLYRVVDAMARAEDFGYQVGQLYQPKDMGKLGEALLQSSTLMDALVTLQSYVHQWVEGSQVLLREDGDSIWLIDRGTDGLSPFRNHTGQATVFLFTNIVRTVAGEQWSPKKARTEANYIDALHIYQDFSETEFFYQAGENAIQIPKGLLSRPISTSKNQEVRLAEQPLNIHQRLKLMIQTHLHAGTLLSAHDAAEITGMASRSFQRQLSEHGVSYRHLLDRVRYERATELLAQDCKIAEIAELLHYSGANNFNRAFKRIAGCTPSMWKQQNI
jgi:AraC-like DNA-binding protein